jgi:Tol biopolymer transport system component
MPKNVFLMCIAVLVADAQAADRVANDSAPQLFAPGTISTPDDEFAIAFEPDGKTAYFTKRSPTTNTPSRSVICVTHLVDGHWSEPQIASFSGIYNDFGTAVSSDGRRLIFSSDRPANATAKNGANIDLWMIEKTEDRWSEPRNLGAPINSEAAEAYPALSADGTLYFASNRAGGAGATDLYRSKFSNGSYAAPENLTQLNSPASESQPAIAADQSFIVFASTGRADAQAAAGAPYPRPDLYVSFRAGDGWTTPVNLGSPINSPDNEGSPALSPDGQWFFFSSDRGFVSIPMTKRLTAEDYERGVHGILNGWNNIYRIPISAVTRRLHTDKKGGTP